MSLVGPLEKLFVIFLVVYLILTACGGNKNTPTVYQSMTSEKSLTQPSTATFLPTQPTSTPTITPFPPYPLKKVVFYYYVIGNQADFDVFFDLAHGNILTRLVLYDDGQMIIDGAGENYSQKVLSTDESDGFLSKLEQLGFYTIESNQEHDPTDKLYNFGNNFQPSSDGLWDCILVDTEKSRELCVREGEKQYLIPEMKNILQYLDDYEPLKVTPYFPDRILITVQTADPSVDNPPAIPWDVSFPSLESLPRLPFLYAPNPTVFIDGDMAKEIYLLFEGTDGNILVSQNGKEYIIDIRVLLPHESVKNPFQ